MTADEISSLLARIGKRPKAMLATRSRPYQELGLARRLPADDELVGLMAEYLALLRRPIIVAGHRGYVGFNRAGIERFAAELREGDNRHA